MTLRYRFSTWIGACKNILELEEPFALWITYEDEDILGTRASVMDG